MTNPLTILLNLIFPDKERDHILVDDGDGYVITVIPQHWWQATHTMQAALDECHRRATAWAKKHPQEVEERRKKRIWWD